MLNYRGVIDGHGRRVYVISGPGHDGRPETVTIRAMALGYWYDSRTVSLSRLTRRQAMKAARSAFGMERGR